MSGDDRWNHSIHYYGRLLDTLPSRGERALDIGCGQGMLTRRLAERFDHVTGIDRDRPSIELAQTISPSTTSETIDFIEADAMTYGFEPASFDAVVSVCALHHIDDTRAALKRFADLVTPGGTLAILGVARFSWQDTPYELAGAISTRAHKVRRTYWEHSAPMVWPPPHTYREVAKLSGEELNGRSYQRLVLWRYLIVWRKA